ncbi:unnamed protein product [Somion occarium]|uniref:Uncharacterized protein n=1 Tax=Somion occarium TaxID=3059160 RepID=A0ABP1DWW8_9APHY
MVCLGRAVANFEFPVERQPVAVEVGLEAFPFGVYRALCASSSRHRSTPLHFFYFPADSPPRLSGIPAMLVSGVRIQLQLHMCWPCDLSDTIRCVAETTND